MTTCDRLVVNVHLAAMTPGTPYGAIRDGALATRDGRIAWVGARADLPAELAAHEELDGRGGWLTPGLIDCHTHLVYAGNRADEFEQRLAGASYEDIARAGGGIMATVRATRAASDDELLRSSEPRLQQLSDEGVTTIEIKSGILRVARALGETHGVEVRTTLLAAHTLPPEYAGRADDYVALVCDEIVPAAAASRLADAVDVFCERIGFSPAQTRRILVRRADSIASALDPRRGHVAARRRTLAAPSDFRSGAPHRAPRCSCAPPWNAIRPATGRGTATCKGRHRRCRRACRRRGRQWRWQAPRRR